MNNRKVRPVNPYPTWALGFLIAPATEQVALQSGVAYSAAGAVALGVCSASLLGRFQVKLPFGKVCNLEIFVTMINESGSRQTTLFERLGAPILARDNQIEIEHQEKMRIYVVENEAWSEINNVILKRLAKAKKKNMPLDHILRELEEHASRKPTKPRRRKIVVNDITYSALVERLEGCHESVAVMTDEGAIISERLNPITRSIYNQCWGGRAVSIDRAHGSSIVAREPHLTSLVMIQTQVYESYRRRSGDDSRGSGYDARCLYLRPPSMVGHRFMSHGDVKPNQDLQKLHDKIQELLDVDPREQFDAGHGPCILEFDEAAGHRWTEYANYVEGQQAPGYYLCDIPETASKAMENVSRVAGILHVMSSQAGKISCDTLSRAYEIVWYHLREAKALFSIEPAMTELDDDCEKLERYFLGKIQSGWVQLPKRYVLKCGPVRDKLRFEAALYCLNAQGKYLISIGHNKAKFINLLLPWVLPQ